MKLGFVLQYCMVTRDYAHRADHDEDEAKATAWDVWTDDNQALAAGVFGAEGEEEMEEVGSHARIVGLEGQEGAVLVPSGIEGTHAVLNPDAAVGAEGDGEVGVAASWIDGAWGGGEGEMRHGAPGVAETRR